MDLSIVVVSWNTKEILIQCLEALARELASFHAEVFVVDNASTDGSPQAVKEKFPQVKLICNEKNLGFAKANNIALRQCTGEYIGLVNSDIIVLEDCFRRMMDFAETHPEIGMLGPKILNPDGTLQHSCMGYPTLWNSFCRAFALDSFFPKTQLFGDRLMTFWPHDAVRSVEVLNGCFWMVRKEALDRVGVLDEEFFFYGEDIDWCKRFRYAGWDVVFSPGAEAIHYGGASSSSAPIRFYLEMQRADMRYWRKHHGNLATIAYLLLTLFHEVNRVLGYGALYFFRPQMRESALFKIRRSLASIRCIFQIARAAPEVR
jgi:GT2 family glycosyltransferase